MSQELNSAVIQALRSRLTSIFPDQIRHCINELTDEQIWWRANDQSNSVGNLVLHVSGSMRHYLCRGIGGFDYERDRPAEFAERGPVSKEKLLSIFNETIELATRTFDSFDPSRLTEPSVEQGYQPTVFDQIFGIAIHLTLHAGQIVYATKMLKEGSVDDLWVKLIFKRP